MKEDIELCDAKVLLKMPDRIVTGFYPLDCRWLRSDFEFDETSGHSVTNRYEHIRDVLSIKEIASLLATAFFTHAIKGYVASNRGVSREKYDRVALPLRGRKGKEIFENWLESEIEEE